ncbi:hypothetical protein [Paraburkholderia sp. GAS42]|uniref:hypothetical protein n=1 Tax=Paraburkholderia sp. GAS42 TaxID=3035135 RepID=UPI003D23B7CF
MSRSSRSRYRCCRKSRASSSSYPPAVKERLSQPGPALLNVTVNPLELVKPPFFEVKPAIGMALYSARAALNGRGADVLEMVRENLL